MYPDLSSPEIVTPTTARLIALGFFADKGKLVKVKTSFRSKINFSDKELLFFIEGDVAESTKSLSIAVKMDNRGDVAKKDVINALQEAIESTNVV